MGIAQMDKSEKLEKQYQELHSRMKQVGILLNEISEICGKNENESLTDLMYVFDKELDDYPYMDLMRPVMDFMEEELGWNTSGLTC